MRSETTNAITSFAKRRDASSGGDGRRFAAAFRRCAFWGPVLSANALWAGSEASDVPGFLTLLNFVT